MIETSRSGSEVQCTRSAGNGQGRPQPRGKQIDFAREPQAWSAATSSARDTFRLHPELDYGQVLQNTVPSHGLLNDARDYQIGS